MKQLLEESEKIEQKRATPPHPEAEHRHDHQRRRKVSNSLAPRIVACEETGEVLESHVTLSALTQHFILIGDHLQLRPQVITYKLSETRPSGKLTTSINPSSSA
ncbi:hypothetical protein BC938DRAFT_478576 [Jimgerdemannia flammicorona]|uniref:DNA2/NAM7 helicase helicase domain-containing protein n=1 Tax=Jimgerdemannia flammicorona TaxID=994334 RepID=A0A433QMQ6_9FUNG|nr:hypothetical protein BC938DRAFT_478576 [Jimgerdemannia flammicorona]